MYGETRGLYRVLVEKPEEKRPLERPRCRNERTILKWIFKKWDGGAWTRLIPLKTGTESGILRMR